MGDKSRIEWTDATWNPVTGCHHAGTPACDNCYARSMAKRLQAMGQANYKDGFAVRQHRHMLEVPTRWSRPRKVFVVSMGDLFHGRVSDGFIAAVFGVMAACPRHQFQVLTKRPERAKQWFDSLAAVAESRGETPTELCAKKSLAVHCFNNSTEFLMAAIDRPWPLANVWFGVTGETQRAAHERTDILRTIPAAVRFVSFEPLLGHITGIDWTGIHWAIVGGESGPGARPMNPRWARDLRDQCEAAGVPLLFKQWGEWNEDGQRVGKKVAGRMLDGKVHDEYPTL